MYLISLNIIIKATIHLGLIMMLTKIFYSNKYYLLLIIYYSSVILFVCIYTDVVYYKSIYFFAYALLLICNYIKFSRIKLNKTRIILKKFINNKNYLKMFLWVVLIFFPYLNYKNMCPVIWAIILPAAFFDKQPLVICIYIYICIVWFLQSFIYILKLKKISQTLVFFFSRQACLSYCGNIVGSKTFRLGSRLIIPTVSGTFGIYYYLDNTFASAGVDAVEGRRLTKISIYDKTPLSLEDSQGVYNTAYNERRMSHSLVCKLPWLFKPRQFYVEHAFQMYEYTQPPAEPPAM